MEIYLVRHTSVNVPAGYAYGQTDVPLRPTFEQFNDWINIPAPSGESLQDQYNRVSHFLDEIRRSSLQKVCLFTHGGVLICAHVYAGKYDLKEAFRNVPSYGTVIKLELD